MSNRKVLLIVIIFLFTINFLISGKNVDLCKYVDPFIGTKEMGHTFPGATVPFGMVQLSPDTDNVQFLIKGKYNKKVYRYCAGYQFNDKTIVGFSHTHFNGTGHSDLGDFLIMPTTGKLILDPGTPENPDLGYRSRFSHTNENAEPGFYQVLLKDYQINAELTATTRVGFHKYTFPKAKDAHIILDLIHSIYGYDGKVIWSSVRVLNNTTVVGYRQTEGWAKARFLYFAMKFSKPFKSYGFVNKNKPKYNGFMGRSIDSSKNYPRMEGKKLRAYFDFETKKSEVIKIKFAISAVDTNGALNNLEKETPNWDFTKIRKKSKNLWNQALNKVQIKASEDKKNIFYTSMYHTFLGPVIYSDIDGRYRGVDQNIHFEKGFTNYTIFSLWDTYRALHPWLTIVEPGRVSDMVNSMLAFYDQNDFKILPIWAFHANEDWCMTGYHGVSVITDAFVKGIKGFDKNKAFKAVVDSADCLPYSGIENYIKYGYIPYDLKFGANSASKTLEYAYDDFNVYQFAKALKKKNETERFKKRAFFYKNLFDKKSNFIRAKKSDGSWLKPFDPIKTEGMGYIEGNAWNFSLHVPHDIQGYIKLVGGNKKFEKILDKVFNMHIPGEAYAHTEDIEASGIMGGYIHGNEPSHHIPYMYNWAGVPWKTQEIIHKIINKMYTTSASGIPGNDDTGQMSAWYLFSSLGFYPVCPGTDQYVIGSPCIEKAVINLDNNKTFTVLAENLSKENIYIKSVSLNGKVLKNSYIKHEDMTNGGILKFVMDKKPNKKWANKSKNSPYSLSRQKN